jgi:hypothetical protein
MCRGPQEVEILELKFLRLSRRPHTGQVIFNFQFGANRDDAVSVAGNDPYAAAGAGFVSASTL